MKLSNFILATDKSWHDELFDHLKHSDTGNWFRVKGINDLHETIDSCNPEMIFFPHWSHIIPENITSQYKCVIFHMTDLPYGRGGSPLQNLIVAGKKDTMMTALLADKGIDTGDVYLKEPLSLTGSAQEIFERSSMVIERMILKIIKSKVEPTPQVGEPTTFKRRTSDMSDIGKLTESEQVYDYIRMLDAEGYPHAYIETNSLKLEFRNARLIDGEVLADVRIIKK